MVKAKCLISESNDPWFNLATEDWIFNDMNPEEHVLFLWRNRECVIIGRNQNPWTECNLTMMRENGVDLVRRHSGGGAVYQDLNNSIFTFLSPKGEYDKKRNFDIITNALKKFGVNAEQIGRNDILVDGRKVSGSAFKEKTDRAFHHGTLMINVDLSKLGNYLTPSKKKMEAKGMKSVRSRVANLKEFNLEITHEKLMDAIISEFFSVYGCDKNIESLNNWNLEQNPGLLRYYEMLKSDDWIFGKTPEFSHYLERRFDWGGIDLHLDCEDGRIRKAKIFSDALNVEMIAEIEEALRGCEYSKEGVEESFRGVKVEGVEDQVREFGEWLKREVE